MPHSAEPPCTRHLVSRKRSPNATTVVRIIRARSLYSNSVSPSHNNQIAVVHYCSDGGSVSRTCTNSLRNDYSGQIDTCNRQWPGVRIPVTESVTGKTHPTQPTIATGLSPRHTQHKGHCSSYVSISGWTIPPIAEIDLCETNLSQVVRIRQTFWPSSYISLEQTKNHVPQYLGTLVWSNVSLLSNYSMYLTCVY